jgi:type IV secretion/conjugal transfer VirB4 family ATPase
MIPTIAFLIACSGIALLLILVGRLWGLDQDKKLNKHRSKDAGLADLLNYAAVMDEGVIVGKNGSLMAAWLYQGEDNASSTDEQREIVSYRINQALSGLGSGWMVHVDAVRRNAPNYSDAGFSHFPDLVTLAIDEERRRYFNNLGTMYEGFFILTVTYFPPVLAQAKFVEMMFDDETGSMDKKTRTLNILEYFKREVNGIESRLATIFKMERLGGRKVITEEGASKTEDDFLRYLQFCVTGLNHPVLLPSNPLYLDALIGGQELWGGVIPKIGRKFIQAVSIEGFPMESAPGILSQLAELPVEYRWNSRFIFMDQHEAIAHLEKFRKKWRQKIRGFFDQVFNTNSGHIDQDAAAMVADAEAAIAEVNSGMTTAGYYTSVVILMDENRPKLEAAAKQIEKSLHSLGFGARVETINTMEAYLGSLPGHGVQNVRRPIMNALNLADLLPVSSIWTGENTAPCPFYPPLSPPLLHCVTTGHAPFRLNLHVRDLGHTILFGPTGNGKSTHLALLASQLRRYPGMSIYAFDKGMSLYPLTKATGGSHFTVAGDNDALSFCPLQFLESRSDRAWAMEWIDTILALNGLNTSPGQRNEIASAIVNMHQTGSRSLTEFVSSIQDKDIREALKQYTVEGSMGHLLDAESDGLALTNFMTFEIEELMGLGEKYALPVLLYLFRRIERSLQGQPAAIIIDEAWLMLGHEAFREKIREWLKALRKANCMVIMATQSLTDASRSGILDVIVESTATKIFLPNIFARDEDTSALYRRMGLNNRQIEIIATAIPKRQYYYVSEKGRRLYDLALGPLALAFVGASDKDSIASMQSLEAKFGPKWVDEWLKSRNLNLHDYIEEYAA